MRRLLIALAIGILSIATSGITLAAPDKNSQELLPGEQQILSDSQKTFSGTKAGSAWNMEVVGHDSIGDRGFNGDVWVHAGYAYVGHWGFQDWASGNDRFCPEPPQSGVAVIDVRAPSDPKRAATLQNPAQTSAEDVVVYRAPYGPLAGHDIAASGIQVCGSRFDLTIPRGLMLWDVTDPAHPVTLGIYETGCCTRGVHEFEIGQRTDLGRTFAYVSVPYSERADASSPNGMRDLLGRGDARIIDITDPTQPFEVSTFGIKKDLGLDPASGQGCFAISFGHGMTPSADGKLLVVSYWDAGFIALDVTTPTAPKFLSRTIYAASADGDAHSASYDDARKLLFTADEDFCKGGPGIEPGWGYMRIWDYSNPRAPRQISSFKTTNSLGSSDPGAGDYVIHNPLVVGTDIYISWYTDGVRVVDASDARHPREVAYFVPPAGQNPVKPAQRSVLTNTTQVWGVVVDEVTGLVYASDMNTGLWILRRTR
ncbi:MAG: hypothetical protein ABJB39_02970 [Chloroflexota bacterium]